MSAYDLVINGRFLEQDLTGVQRFAEELTLRVLDAFPGAVVLAPRKRRTLPQRYEQRVISTRLGSGHLWEQIVLPTWISRHGHPLVVNLSSTAAVILKRQLVTHHDITYIRHPESFSRGFRSLYAALIPLILRRNLGIITVSNFSKQEIATHYGIPEARFSVIYNAVSNSFTSPQSVNVDDKDPYFLAVSSINRHKNFDYLLSEYAQARKDGLRYRLKIVGGTARSFSVDVNASRVGGIPAEDTPGLEWLGRVSDEELADLYANAAGFVFPTLYEGFGIPPLEAQASSTPVISSAAASLPEVLGESALYADPVQPGSFASAMLRLSNDKQLQDSLRSAGIENVQRFSWERSAEALGKLITGCMS